MDQSDSQKIFEFVHLITALKEVERWRGHYFWRDYPQRARYESVADHTWRMAVMLVLIEKRLSQPIDLAKAIKMVLVHDLPEMLVGDPSPLGSDGTGKDSHAYNKEVSDAKFEREKEAAQNIFKNLSEPESSEMFKLWLEFEEQSSFESKVVKAIDKLEGKFQCAEYLPEASFKEHQKFNVTYGVETFEVDPFIKELWSFVNEEFTKDFKEFTKEVQ